MTDPIRPDGGLVGSQFREDVPARDQPARLFEKVAALLIAREDCMDDPERMRQIYQDCSRRWRTTRGAARNRLRDEWREMLAEVDRAGDVEIVE